MKTPQHTPGGGRLRLAAAAAAAVLGLGGVATVSLAVADRHGSAPPPGPSAAAGDLRGTTDPATVPPAPSPSASPSDPTAAPAPARTVPLPGGGAALPASAPTGLDIPAIGVHTSLVRLGRNTDGTVQVPAEPLKAGWYQDSPTPGGLGAAVILGHVDSRETGPAVFYRLGSLRPGTGITVTREDGTTAVFTTDTVREYPKDQFPTLDVYSTTSDRPQLRLITCGDWDARTRSYLGNTVVFATLTRTGP